MVYALQQKEVFAGKMAVIFDKKEYPKVRVNKKGCRKTIVPVLKYPVRIDKAACLFADLLLYMCLYLQSSVCRYVCIYRIRRSAAKIKTGTVSMEQMVVKA